MPTTLEWDIGTFDQNDGFTPFTQLTDLVPSSLEPGTPAAGQGGPEARKTATGILDGVWSAFMARLDHFGHPLDRHWTTDGVTYLTLFDGVAHVSG